MVTVIGFIYIIDNSSKSSTSYHFTIEMSIYDVSKSVPVQFSMTCFLENIKCWQKVKTPLSGIFLIKIVSYTADTNHLALQVLDLIYLLKPALAAAIPILTVIPLSIWSNRWKGWADLFTPFKRPCISDSTNDPIEDLINSITLLASLSTVIHPEDSLFILT